MYEQARSIVFECFEGEFKGTVLSTPPPEKNNPGSAPDKVRLHFIFSFTLSVGARLLPAVHPRRPSPLSYR